MIFIVFFVVAISGCTSNDSHSSNSKGSSNDVYVVVEYPGSWAADVSGLFGYRSLSGTGNQTTNLGSISTTVTASVRKTDDTNDVLTVKIIKDGKVLASQSTSYPYGGASATATGF
ncbi:MAG: hypothetical protein LLF83_01735 [Methanobacterium sp.]|nr:hypothetical protein [Methanobacterium sp.]